MKKTLLALGMVIITASAITAPAKKPQYTCTKCGIVTTKKVNSDVCPKSPLKKGSHSYEEIK